MSFGDTMTTLLAFFIVLVSLAENQTGANLHAGTGSFMATMKTGGMPGVFSGDKSKQTVQMEATSPLYRAEEDTDDSDGPNEDSEIQSVDREKEEFSRFLNEMDLMASLDKGVETTGETTFDFFEKFSDEPPYLPSNYDVIAIRILPVIRRAGYRVELIVWAPTPAASAISRSVLRANELRNRILSDAGITPKGDVAKRLFGLSRTWPYAKMKRPIMSVVIRRVE